MQRLSVAWPTPLPRRSSPRPATRSSDEEASAAGAPWTRPEVVVAAVGPAVAAAAAIVVALLLALVAVALPLALTQILPAVIPIPYLDTTRPL